MALDFLNVKLILQLFLKKQKQLMLINQLINFIGVGIILVHNTMEFGEQFSGVGSFPPPGSWGSNSGNQDYAYWATFPTQIAY